MSWVAWGAARTVLAEVEGVLHFLSSPSSWGGGRDSQKRRDLKISRFPYRIGRFVWGGRDADGVGTCSVVPVHSQTVSDQIFEPVLESVNFTGKSVSRESVSSGI